MYTLWIHYNTFFSEWLPVYASGWWSIITVLFCYDKLLGSRIFAPWMVSWIYAIFRLRCAICRSTLDSKTLGCRNHISKNSRFAMVGLVAELIEQRTQLLYCLRGLSIFRLRANLSIDVFYRLCKSTNCAEHIYVAEMNWQIRMKTCSINVMVSLRVPT